ncbi:hypothetical protein [Pseudoxanthomonas sp. CF125]|uniref:hypothetical protein n=1 Tax=Pseudoxanthomonas sp. CF125 TaxID=1855303 RepID=UPI00088D17BA|nr:hypothetical protein [Pseudoxanthomonas sp. CF125]SDQ41946.1 hypothetical protein SAMN05216569_1054 [Pseudoxanthomonas sp. CF125]
MATLQELENGLRKAHEAGNAEHAKLFAAEIRKMRTAPEAAPVQDMAPVEVRPDPTEGMGWYEKYRAGLGKSLVDTYEGLKQFGVEAIGELSGDRTGLTGTSKLESLTSGEKPGSNAVTRWADRKGQELRGAEAERRRLNEPLMNTGGGMFGNVVGTVSQLFAPGAALRGTTVGSALLPATIRGNALQGLAMGAIQPVAAEGERAQNTALGGLAGSAGAAVPKAGGALLKLLKGSGGRATQTGAQSRAAELVRGEATSLDKLMQPEPSAIPGVQRSLAEESLDPGIARLERLVRGKSNDFQPVDTANNAARVAALGKFAGDESTLRAAQSARTAASKPLLGEAYLDKGVDTNAIRAFVEKSAADNATRPSVQSAILDVSKALNSAGDDVVSLYGVRKYIGDLLSGKAGGDKTYAKAASAELKDIQSVLDEEIAKKSPAFGKYLAAFKDGSKPINRMQIGQDLIESGGAVLDPQTGLQVLTPAAFAKKARDLDAVAARATGFKKARAADSLLPEDIATIRAVQDDLSRQSFRATAGSGGNSQTAERLMLQDKIGSGLLSKVPVLGGFVEVLNTIGNQKVNTQLARMLAEPEYARKVLATLSKSDRSVVTKALIQLGGRTGSAVPALTE